MDLRDTFFQVADRIDELTHEGKGYRVASFALIRGDGPLQFTRYLHVGDLAIKRLVAQSDHWFDSVQLPEPENQEDGAENVVVQNVDELQALGFNLGEDDNFGIPQQAEVVIPGGGQGLGLAIGAPAAVQGGGGGGGAPAAVQGGGAPAAHVWDRFSYSFGTNAADMEAIQAGRVVFLTGLGTVSSVAELCREMRLSFGTKYGHVSRIWLPRNNEARGGANEPRGGAFLTFQSSNAAQAMVQDADEHLVAGQWIRSMAHGPFKST